MKQTVYYFSLLVAFCISCDDIFVKDISVNEIIIICPRDNWEFKLEDDSTAIVFWWEYMNGADNYELQLVSPDFSNINKVLFDVVVDSTNKYSTVLPAGQYQWRIRAKNNSFSTDYITRTFLLLENDKPADNPQEEEEKEDQLENDL